MSFREPVCHGCGRVGTTKRDCEQCNKDSGCNYCHSKNHAIKDCPKIKPCRLCNNKGHRPEHCPEVTGRPQIHASSLPRNLPAPQSSRAYSANASRKATTPSHAHSASSSRKATTPSPAPGVASFPQQCLSIAVPTVPHDDDEWKEIPEEVRSHLDVFETFTFPDLDELSQQTLVDIMNDLIEGSK